MTPTTVDNPGLTRTGQDPYSSAALVAALETCWEAIRTRHPQIPAVVVIVGSGSATNKTSHLKFGHYASLRWQVGQTQLAEVLVSGEGLRRSPGEVLTTLLHEAAHALADRRGIQETSRQGRWHNQHFATLAGELGLVTSKHPKFGWSPCTLRADTAETYRPVLDQLGVAMRAYRHPEQITPRQRPNNNNGHTLTCACPRKIRVSATVADQGTIRCGRCNAAFTADGHPQPEGDTDMAATFYDPTGEHHGGLPTYPYKFAPQGLATRRQLRALGLRPNGQAIAAQILWRNGKRVAYLYRVDLAAPKRTATPAQRQALDKATRARRTCPTCRQVKTYHIPRRYGECLDCTPGGPR